MIVLLTEEPSMSECLKIIISELWPNFIPGVDWLVLSFYGKRDLEQSIPIKMQEWNYGNPNFIILRDNDGGDCFAIKEKLCAIAKQYDKPFRVRIVCQQLESWLLGDLNAIKQAYPKAPIKDKAKFREPDRLTNASQELENLINVRAKIERARNIGRHLDFKANRSRSFHLFIDTVRHLIPSG